MAKCRSQRRKIEVDGAIVLEDRGVVDQQADRPERRCRRCDQRRRPALMSVRSACDHDRACRPPRDLFGERFGLRRRERLQWIATAKPMRRKIFDDRPADPLGAARHQGRLDPVRHVSPWRRSDLADDCWKSPPPAVHGFVVQCGAAADQAPAAHPTFAGRRLI